MPTIRERSGRSGYEDASLRGYLEGDEGAVRRIDRWILEVLRGSYPILRGCHDDLSQEIHEKLLRSLRFERYRGSGSLRRYVARIAHNTALDVVRRRYREKSLEAFREDDGPNPYDLLEAKERAQQLHRLILQCPPSCLELWKIVFIERLSYAEVAKRLGVPLGTVKSRMWICRRRLGEAFRRLERARRRPRRARRYRDA
jgi:RNA polymerase sigma-70 factor (ECF subfamily)